MLFCTTSLDSNVLFLLLLSFTAASPFDTSLKFLAIGDWGGLPFFPYKTFVEMNVGRDMAFISEKLDVNFILALGDNFYLKGVHDIHDLRFKETYESAFNYTSLNIPWFVIAGNHDHYGNVSAQIMYSSRSNRWNFPDFYYKKKFKLVNSYVYVDLIMTDSVILCGNTMLDQYFQPSLDPGNLYRSEKHWKWLEQVLEDSKNSRKLCFKFEKADYLLVCGHFPIYSIGSHGSTDCLVSRLQPLLEKYNVTAYFSGHDHNIQHIQVRNSTMTTDYFVSGAANFIDPSKKHKEKLPPGSLLFHWSNPFSLGAFAYVKINAKELTVDFLLNAEKIYSYSIGPRF